MHHYLQIQVHGTRTWLMRSSKISLSTWFVRPNGQHVCLGEVPDTVIAGTHDLEHLAAGVGYSVNEEAMTGAFISQYGLATRDNWYKSTGFSREDIKNYNKFLSNMFWKNKAGTWHLSMVTGKLTFEQVS